MYTERNYRRAIFVMVIVLLALAGALRKAHAGEVTIEPWLGDTHISDIFTGVPFFAQPPGCEQTTDFLGGGLTVSWKKFEFDFAQGIKARDWWCGRPWREKSQSGTMLSFRWYPLRKR